jgi:hypothetical protein
MLFCQYYTYIHDDYYLMLFYQHCTYIHDENMFTNIRYRNDTCIGVHKYHKITLNNSRHEYRYNTDKITLNNIRHEYRYNTDKITLNISRHEYRPYCTYIHDD